MIRFFAAHPTAANLLMLIFIVLGLVSLPDMQRETYPEFEPSTIRVSASYPGADAEIVDETLLQPLELAISGLDGVGSLRSQAREGSASITVELADGASLAEVLVDVRSAVDGVRDLPAELDQDPPRVSATSRRASVASIAVTGPMSANDLKLYCEQLRRELLRDPEVSQVTLAGFSTHQLLIQLKPGALARHGLTLADITTAITAQSVDQPVGTLKRLTGDILVRYSDKRSDVEGLADIVVKSAATGGAVRIGDVADVRDTFKVEAEQLQFNGTRACILNVSKTAWQDSLTVLAAIENFIANHDARKPSGVTLAITQNTAAAVGKQINLLTNNAVQGLLLVFLTLWLFFHVRLAFWVAVGLPVSVLGSLWALGLVGQTINMMTMMGMLIALGLVMDDAIVLAENFAAHRERGKSALQAAVDGVREVSGGVISSFLTTACVFIPLMGIEGRIGRVLQVIPIILIVVLVVSLIEGFFVLPAHLAHSMKHVDPNRPSRPRAAFDRVFERVRERGLGRVVDLAVRHRWASLGLAIAIMLGSIGMFTSGRLRYVAFPAAEGDVAEFRLALPPGAPLARTQQQVDRVVAAAWKVNEDLSPLQPDGKPLVRNVLTRFNFNSDVEETGPHLATVSVDLLSVEDRETTLDAFAKAWREATGPLGGSASSRFTSGSRRGPAGNAIEVEIQAEDLERAKAVSLRIQAWFGEFPGVSDLSDNLVAGSPQVRLRLRPGAGGSGLTASALATQVRSHLSGAQIQTFHHKGEEYELFVEMDPSSRDSIADLEFLPIRLSTGEAAPLGTLAAIDLMHSYARINRFDGARTVTVVGSVEEESANAAELMQRFTEVLAPQLETDYPDVRLSVGGAAQQSAQAIGSMTTRMAVGLFGVFVLLSLQFRSWVAPVVVLLAVPFAFVGVIWGHLLMGMPLSSQSIFGLVAISGVVVNDSILLMVFLFSSRGSGASPLDAARQASRDRFRAVFLTSATTIAGLFPLMFETSRHAQTLVPVATSIVFGMAASTVLVLLIIPATYAALSDLGLAPEPEHPDPPQPLETPS